MEDENTRHAEKMRKIKAARDKMMEGKTEEKGLISPERLAHRKRADP